MSNNTPDQLEAICEIANIDKQLFKISRLKSELPGEIQSMKLEEQSLSKEQVALKEQISVDKVFIKNEELAIIDRKEAIKNLEIQKSSISNSKEYAAVSKAIELNSLEIQLSEKKIRNTITSIEKVSSKLKAIEECMGNMSIVLQSKISDLETLLVNSEKQEKELKETRNNIAEKISKEVISRYDRVRGVNKTGMGASYVERGACGACFMVIPLQQQIDVSVCKIENQMHRCDYCGAILLGVSFDNIDEQGYSSRYSEDDHTFSSRGV